MPILTFGRGTLHELGSRATARGLKRVALFTDPGLCDGPLVAMAKSSLEASGLTVQVYSDIRIEPCDDTVMRAKAFLDNAKTDGVVSVGGGSVMDTAKAALAMHQFDGHILDYFAAPIGSGKTIPGPLAPHIACPTTSGTGSECTSLSVIRINELDCKFVVASPYLLPTDAIVDPACCDSLPANIVASTGFDLMSHALECFTAKAYTKHAHVKNPQQRQYIQGANPFSDLAAINALEIVGDYLIRGVADASDHEARDQLMFGATLAGIAFGNSGTHLPHAMSYGVTHLMQNITTKDYNVDSPFVPHGISVVVSAPAIFNYTAEAEPERHLEGAKHLRADLHGATPQDAGEVLSKRIVELMKRTDMPNGLSGVGFTANDVSSMAESSFRQKRAIANAPRESNLVDIENMYNAALNYW
ncbi:MAG: iron-containing alcohol dehydrogenase [Gammaproteobacteria bacterium]|nr:iron-containing alcohol dehydrogenase [Gammaproteobacteria bacterium]